MYTLDLKKYADLARKASAEGCVLLENEEETLPICGGKKTAVFGRTAFHYQKSGLGSGGLVNTRYVVEIIDALRETPELVVNEKLVEIYKAWLEKNPFDEGKGWGKVPWAQKEMPVTEEMLKEAEASDISLIVIGRTAGEDQDNLCEPGSYLLSETEEQLIEKVTQVSKRTVVVLNVGNIIDMKWVEKYHPQAVLYAWQGGQEGANGLVDVLTGRVNACGKLTDTIAYDLADYPSTKHFGDLHRNYYEEDVYVGYRYFETFAKDKVLYPFGYGLSYSAFSIEGKLEEVGDKELAVEVVVTNTGKYPGKEVVQVYAKAAQGELGNPERKLVAFGKTKELKPGEQEKLFFKVKKYEMASFDDCGITGFRYSYVLEPGKYEIYVGKDVRSAVLAGAYEEPEVVEVEKLETAGAPTLAMFRLRPQKGKDGSLRVQKEPVPMRQVDPRKRLLENRPEEIPYTGRKGYLLSDVKKGKISMSEFIAQLTEKELKTLFYGEGMCSPKVTAGTASAFGGLTEELRELGIPAACTSDGPSGIRMDCGTKAMLLPNGTMLGCTFNLELVEKLYEMTGLELRLNRIDSLLGPGMNLHRNPLNGRNFEYFSEDPLLTGKMGAAQIQGMQKYGVTGTVKHFCCNNQEAGRHTTDAVVSERALRELYLRGFEIAVKEGKARSVMTTYGSTNGIWTAGSYDLCTTILRKEWGFEGIVMTDWWAKANYEGEAADPKVKAPMIAAQNDLFMCTQDASVGEEGDDLEKKWQEGYFTKAELQRNAANILGFILQSPAMLYEMGEITEEELQAGKDNSADSVQASEIEYYRPDPKTGEVLIDVEKLHPAAGKTDTFGIILDKQGECFITMWISSELGPLAQLPISIFYDNIHVTTVSIRGTEGKCVEETRSLGPMFGRNHFVKLYYGANGIRIEKIRIFKKE